MASKKKTAAEALRKAFHASGMTPAKLATLTGTHRATVGRFLNDSDPQLSTAEQWAKALGYRLELTKEKSDDS